MASHGMAGTGPEIWSTVRMNGAAAGPAADMEAAVPRRTRIQQEKRELILDAALDVFSAHGFRGATIDRIADAAGMSKPNLLYYFRRKQDIYETLMQRLLGTWLAPLKELDDTGDPLTELLGYIRRKLEMARDYPRESRLFANEILRGAPRIKQARAQRRYCRRTCKGNLAWSAVGLRGRWSPSDEGKPQRERCASHVPLIRCSRRAFGRPSC